MTLQSSQTILLKALASPTPEAENKTKTKKDEVSAPGAQASLKHPFTQPQLLNLLSGSNWFLNCKPRPELKTISQQTWHATYKSSSLHPGLGFHMKSTLPR